MALVRLPQKDLAPHEHPAKLTHHPLGAGVVSSRSGTQVPTYLRQAALQLKLPAVVEMVLRFCDLEFAHMRSENMPCDSNV